MFKQDYLSLSLLSVISIGVLMAGCNGNNADREHFHSGYFDMRQYIDGQVNDLVKNDPLVEKTAYLNGKIEHREVHFDKKQWQTELDPFLEADINKPAFVKRYEADTLKINDTTTCLTYKALDDKLHTRELKIFFYKSEAAPYKLEAELRADKVFYKSGQFITYTQGAGYKVQGHQDIVLFGADTFAVQARL